MLLCLTPTTLEISIIVYLRFLRKAGQVTGSDCCDSYDEPFLRFVQLP